ncbi:MAG TPA: Uma2 family endonuclease [Pyrinomonadaceae bacterium]|nr:Uma2 family endonuclease [Pyrinomonadaceae bacterium]
MAGDVQTVRSTETYLPTQTFTLDFHSARLTEEQFEELCRNNRDLKFEMSAKGELIIVPPTSPESGWKNTKLITRTELWSEEDHTGIVFDSSTMFTLPNGAKRSPDVSWMTKEKWESLSPSERQKFSRVVPDFVIELLSPTDNLADTQAKMEEYVENGVRLGWLIDPVEQKVHIYRAGGEIEILDNPETVSGEDVLRGFELNVRQIW